MANRNNSKTAATANAKVAPALRAAAIVARHGMAGQARAIAATGAAAASAKRYSARLGSLNPAFAAATFTLTPLGKQAVAANGCIGSKGQPTVMGLFAVALANATAANNGAPATGQQVCLAMLGNPQLMQAALATKAAGTHLIPANTTAMGWAQGYVNGLCRSAHGLAKKALA
jgi:hypothetical protein